MSRTDFAPEPVFPRTPTRVVGALLTAAGALLCYDDLFVPIRQMQARAPTVTFREENAFVGVLSLVCGLFCVIFTRHAAAFRGETGRRRRLWIVAAIGFGAGLATTRTVQTFANQYGYRVPIGGSTLWRAD